MSAIRNVSVKIDIELSTGGPKADRGRSAMYMGAYGCSVELEAFALKSSCTTSGICAVAPLNTKRGYQTLASSQQMPVACNVPASA